MPRTMEIATPLGEDLLFHGMRAREELGRLGHYCVDLLSPRGDIDLDEILGQNVTVKMAVAEDSWRYFNGHVTRFSQTGAIGRYHCYAAVVRPWLWFLTRTADCRIFQEMTVPDILRQVFGDHATADVAWELTGSYRQWVYCVQYRETDFNFVSRLMEQEGLYYYVRHTEGHNTLVITDATSQHRAAPGYDSISYAAPEQFSRPEDEHITAWALSREIQPGAFQHTDYDFERPGVRLHTDKNHPRGFSPSDYEVFDYPGEYIQKGHGTQYAEVRMDELSTQFETAEAATNCRGLGVGHLFTLDGCPRADQDGEYLVVSASYDLTYGSYEGLDGTPAAYECSFAATSTRQQFRPARTTPKPFVQGPQTAVVVGPPGEEIHTDKYGRIKVQFHWDRYGTKDDNSSCWIRVSHPWAGKNWGAIATPRIGQEVIVDFLEGDPDQPIITGRVYNAEQMPPYDLPAKKTQTGIKSRSSKNGGPPNFNEIRFEDLKGQEQLFIHAERNMDIEVEVNETHWVGHDRTRTIDHDEQVHVKNNRKKQIDVDETVLVGSNRTETVGGNETISIGGHRSEKVGSGEDVTVVGGRSHTIVGAQSTTISTSETLTIGANRAQTVGGSETIAVGAKRSIRVGAVQKVVVGAAQTITVGGVQKLTAGVIQENSKGPLKMKAGGAAELRASSITLKAGGSTIQMTSGGITIKASKITLQASGGVKVKAGGSVTIKGATIKEN